MAPMMTESQRAHAAAVRVLEPEAFSGKYDEQDVRAKSKHGMEAFGRLLAAAAILRGQAAAALEAHRADEVAWTRELKEARGVGEMWRVLLVAELRRADAETAAAVQAAGVTQRQLVGESAASMGQQERLEREIRECHEREAMHTIQLQTALSTLEQVPPSLHKMRSQHRLPCCQQPVSLTPLTGCSRQIPPQLFPFADITDNLSPCCVSCHTCARRCALRPASNSTSYATRTAGSAMMCYAARRHSSGPRDSNQCPPSDRRVVLRDQRPSLRAPMCPSCGRWSLLLSTRPCKNSRRGCGKSTPGWRQG